MDSHRLDALTMRLDMMPSRRTVLKALAGSAAAGWVSLRFGTPVAGVAADTPDATLRELATLKGYQIGAATGVGALRDPTYVEVFVGEFNTMVIEGRPLIWGGQIGGLRPEADRYEFSYADTLVDFADEHRLHVEGHHLAWGRPDALPDWLLKGDYSPQQVIRLLQDHVGTVVDRYKGRIGRWSVVNEPFEEDGSYKTGPARWGWWNDHSPWSDGIDPDYIEAAFRAAHEADDHARLIVNEYAAEEVNPKSDALYNLVARLKQKGVPVHGVGLQMHLPNAPRLPDPSSVAANMRRFKEDLGVRVYVTEADVDISPDNGVIPGVSRDERYQSQADIYRSMFRACVESGACNCFSVFAVEDGGHWLVWSGRPEADPVLFDRNFEPKPAYRALHEELLALPDKA